MDPIEIGLGLGGPAAYGVLGSCGVFARWPLVGLSGLWARMPWSLAGLTVATNRGQVPHSHVLPRR